MALKHREEWIKIGLNVAYYRKLRNLTQETLAENIDMSRNHIQRLESGSPVSVNTLLDIAHELGVPAYKLLEFRD